MVHIVLISQETSVQQFVIDLPVLHSALSLNHQTLPYVSMSMKKKIGQLEYEFAWVMHNTMTHYIQTIPQKKTNATINHRPVQVGRVG